MKSLRFGLFALLLCFATVAVSAPAIAQVQSLEDLMAEVDEDIAEAPDAGTPEPVDEAPAIEAPADEGLAPARPALDTASGPDLPPFFVPGLVGLLILLLLLGQPLYVVIGSLTMYLLFFGGIFNEFRLLTSVIEQTRGLADQAVLLAIPFFVISGALMTEGDIARRLIAFAQSVFGWLPGGLAISAVFACVFFAAISGSSPVTVIAIGSIMYPALIKREYPEGFSAGLVTSAGSLGILIPPSIPMIVYAIVDPTALQDPVGYTISSGGGGDAGVKDLFIAGMGPGILIGLVFAGYSLYIGRKYKIPRIGFEWPRVWKTFRDGFWALNLPIIILGGIYTGIFTPTQAAAVAVVYAAVVEFFIHRSLKLDDIPRIFAESAVLMGSLLIIMALALGFNLYLDRAKIPEQAVEMILAMDLSIITFLLIVNVLLLIVGCFMDILSAILILVPLLAPIGFGLGIHPLHLAVVFIVNLEIGYLTPPIGLNLFVASTLFKKGLGEIVRAVLPFLVLMMGCLMLVTYVPTVSLGLVSVSKGGDFFVPFPDGPKKAAANGVTPAAPAAEAPDPVVQANDDEVKSLEELMGEVDDDLGEADAGALEAEAAPRVKSLEELMNEVE